VTEVVTTIEITLSRVITEDGRLEVRVKTPDRFSAVEALGLIEAAKFHICQNMDQWRRDDDE
jgi:hypothetical protein